MVKQTTIITNICTTLGDSHARGRLPHNISPKKQPEIYLRTSRLSAVLRQWRITALGTVRDIRLEMLSPSMALAMAATLPTRRISSAGLCCEWPLCCFGCRAVPGVFAAEKSF
jgi:hypothetical protein